MFLSRNSSESPARASLLESVTHHWPAGVGSLTFMAASAAATAGYAWLAGPLLTRLEAVSVSQNSLGDAAQTQSTTSLTLEAIVLWLIALGLGRALFETLRAHFAARLQLAVVREMRGKILEHVLFLSPVTLRRWTRGELASRIQVEVHGLRALLHLGLAQGVRSLLVATALAIVALKVDTGLAIPGLMLLPVAVLLVVAAARPARRFQAHLMTAETAVVSATTEAVDGALVLRAYGASRNQVARIDRRAAHAVRRGIAAETWGTVAAPLVELVAAIGIAFAVGVAWASRGGVDLESTGTVLAALVLMFRPLHGLAQSVFGWSSGLACLDRLDELLRLPSGPRPPEPRTRRDCRSVSIRGATFSYGLEPVLDRARGVFSRGELVVVTGPSGSGKSTFLALLGGLLQPDHGDIALDGDPATAPARLATAAWMSQTPQLFHDSIVSNITLGDAVPDRRRMLAAAVEAGVDEFVNDRPHGYEAVIRENGEDLSLGQRQRIALARAFYRKASMLLLDEPTSALDDTHAERIVRACRARADAGQLVFVATHRSDFLRQADRVVEVRSGGIYEWAQSDQRPFLH